jgi:HK97 family phage prohead protease
VSHRRTIFTADARFAVAAQAEGKPPTLTGYALIWGATSSDRGGYRVRLMPGSAKFATPTLALFHHDFKHVLGTTGNGTLRIAPDDTGVRVEIDLPDTTTGRDVAELIRRRDITGMSFAMIDKPQGRTVKEGGVEIFEAESYGVDEITVTVSPAFIETTIDIKRDPAEYAARTAQSIKLQRFRLDLYPLVRP